MDSLKKHSYFYYILLFLWTIITVFLWFQFVPSIINPAFTQPVTDLENILTRILIACNGLFISYFWLNGVKDFIYVIWYTFAKRKLIKKYEYVKSIDTSQANDRVLLLYCTCNDFDGSSLAECMKQDYGNFETVILDDSSKEEYKKEIDKFAKKHDVRVVRRFDRVGFKAGNINNFLLSDGIRGGSYDYVVILDSDEIIPHNYIRKALKYFYAYNNVGVVQANHVSTRNRNFFMKLFHIGVNSHWPTYQIMKHNYGFSSMLGHGAMIKRECYEQIGGFPNLVAEDLCLSIEARNYGYYVAFAPEIICEEEYPIDYVAFKKRHSKWTQGNLEFIKNYTSKIVKSKMHWFEKLDIVLFTYNLPLTAVFAFYIFINLIFLPLLHVNLSAIYTWWMLILTIIFFLSPMLNDFICWFFRLNIFRSILYTLCVIVLYGSMLTTSLISALLGIFGKKAKFIVTPKACEKMTLFRALWFQKYEILFSTFLLAISIIFCRSILPVILIIGTGYLSVFLMFFSNKTYDKEKTNAIDLQTKYRLNFGD